MVDLLSAGLAWGLFVGIGVLGVATTVIASRNVYRSLTRAARSEGQAQSLTVLTAFALFAGGWIFVILVWVARSLTRSLRGVLITSAHQS